MPIISLSKRNLGIHAGTGHIGVHIHVSAHIHIGVGATHAHSSIHIHIGVHSVHANIHICIHTHSSVIVHVGVHAHTTHICPHLHVRAIHVDVHIHTITIVGVGSGDLVITMDRLQGLHVNRGRHVVVDDNGFCAQTSVTSRPEATPFDHSLGSTADASVVETVVSQTVTLAYMAAFGIDQSQVFGLAAPPGIYEISFVAPSTADSTIVVPPAVTDETLTHSYYYQILLMAPSIYCFFSRGRGYIPQTKIGHLFSYVLNYNNIKHHFGFQISSSSFSFSMMFEN